MNTHIPPVIEELYHSWITEPNPSLWPDYLKDYPVKGHGLWSFYQGLQLGLQLGDACFDRR